MDLIEALLRDIEELVMSGTPTNTVPAQGRVSVAVRMRTLFEQQRVDTVMDALRPVLDGARRDVGGGPNRAALLRELLVHLLAGVARTARS